MPFANQKGVVRFAVFSQNGEVLWGRFTNLVFVCWGGFDQFGGV